MPAETWEEQAVDPDALPDERLALFFTCCHPALALDARVALTLRLVGGVATADVAGLFLVSEPTMAARLTRAKRRIARAGIPFREPDPAQRAERMSGVLAVVYLLFSEGYAPAGGEDALRLPLAEEAIRLGALLHGLSPDDAEIAGLLALMMLQHARRDARIDADGGLVTLPRQDRTRWRWDEIARAAALLTATEGCYALQARIALAHSRPEGSDWPTIAALYARLEAIHPSPAVRINRAVAVGEAEGAAAGLELLRDWEPPEPLLGKCALVRGELLARAERPDDAAAALDEAARRSRNDVERRHIESRLREVRTGVLASDP